MNKDNTTSNLNNVLVFPPFPNRLRFIVHKTVEECYPDLKTFSIGMFEERRLVVYRDREHNIKLTSSFNQMDASANTSSRLKQSQVITNNKPIRTKYRRPDMQLYIPRAKRKNDTELTEVPIESSTVDILESENKTKVKSPKKTVKENRDVKINDQVEELNLVKNDELIVDTSEQINSSENQCVREEENAVFISGQLEDACESCLCGIQIPLPEEKEVKMESEESSKSEISVGLKNEFETKKINMDLEKVAETKEINVDLEKVAETEEISVDLEKVAETKEINVDLEKVTETKEINVDLEKVAETKEINVDLEKVTETKEINVDLEKVAETKETSMKLENVFEIEEKKVETGNTESQCSSKLTESENFVDISLLSETDIEMNSVISNRLSSICNSEESIKDSEESSWEALYNEDGECLAPDLVQELTDNLGQVTIEKPKIDYTKFQPKIIKDHEYDHIIEIYDFPLEFKTPDLISAFSAFRDRGFDIKWVDDTHALGLFASPIAATEALSMRHSVLKTRALSEATRESQLKARRCGEPLQPYKPRPETSASLARRLVTGALGLNSLIPREQRAKERQQLKDAKAKKKLTAKQKKDVWEGTIN